MKTIGAREQALRDARERKFEDDSKVARATKAKAKIATITPANVGKQKKAKKS